MTDAFATHEVFNQSPPFEDVNLFTTDKALMEAVAREGGGHAAKRLAAFGAQCGSAEAFNAAASPTSIRPASSPSTPRAAGSTWSSSIPAYHECMELSINEGLHCSAWEHLAKPGRKPVAGANVARSAGTYMAIQMEAGHQCPITMTNAAVPTLLLQPEIGRVVGAEGAVARIRQELQAGGGEARRHHRHGHDGEAGRHRRARQHDDGRAGRRRGPGGEYRSPATNGSCRRRCAMPSWCWRRRRAGSPAS